MTDEQKVVFEAVSRGRLIFPFRDEMRALREQAKQGPLTKGESKRLEQIEGAFQKIKVEDEAFHQAMLNGNIEAAGRVAQKALAILKEVA